MVTKLMIIIDSFLEKGGRDVTSPGAEPMD